MSWNNVSSILSEQNIGLFDWDNNRGGEDGAGQYILGKVEFAGKRIFEKDTLQHRYGLGVRIHPEDLKGKTDQEIAQIFVTVFKTFDRTTIKGRQFQPISIHLRTADSEGFPEKPFLFIMGDAQSN